MKKLSVEFSPQKKANGRAGEILFSIIIPMYNVERYIGECLRSVIGQSFCSIEIIVIDDQSSDNSVSNCLVLIDQGYDFILLGQKQAGPNVARNLGMKYATGKYVIFIDADDRLSLNALDRLSTELRQFPETEVISFGYEFFNDETGDSRKVSRPSKRHLKSKDIFIESLRGRDFGGVCWNKCYKRAFLLDRDISFIPDRVHGRDLIFSRAVAFYAEDWRSIDVVLYQSRLRSGSYSRDFSERNINSAIDVATKHLDIFHDGAVVLGAVNDLYYAIHRHLRYIIILSAFRSRSFKEHKSYFNLIQRFSLNSVLKSYSTQNNGRFLNKVIYYLTGNPRLIWTIAKILKSLNYEPY